MNLRSENAALYLLALSQISTVVVAEQQWRQRRRAAPVLEGGAGGGGDLAGKEVGLKPTSRTLLSRSSSFSSASRCLSTPSSLLISSAANLSGSTWMSFGMRSVRWGGEGGQRQAVSGSVHFITIRNQWRKSRTQANWTVPAGKSLIFRSTLLLAYSPPHIKALFSFSEPSKNAMTLQSFDITYRNEPCKRVRVIRRVCSDEIKILLCC